MRTFNESKKVFIKSNNNSNKILNRYNYSLILVLAYITIYNLIWGEPKVVLNLLVSVSLSVGLSIILQYCMNLLKGKNNIKILIKEDNIFTYSIILGIFLLDTPLTVSIVAIMITNIIKNTYYGINTASSLFGILFIIIYKYYNNDLVTPLSLISSTNYEGLHGIVKYIFGINTSCVSPALSLIIFGYLFHKKSIKYNLFFSYIITIFLMFIAFSLMNNVGISYSLFELLTGNLLFLSIFCLTDFRITPTTNEGQVIYGTFLGIITTILRFIIPNISVIVALIFGSILFTRIINKISFKLKYDKKFYYMMISIEILLAIIFTITLSFFY